MPNDQQNAPLDERMLIIGGGISGLVLAYWLGQHGYQVTIVERSQQRDQAQAGQQIVDIQRHAQNTLAAMGVLESVRVEAVKDCGVAFVNSKSRQLACFRRRSRSLEITRPALWKILFDVVRQLNNINIRFGCTIVALDNKEHCVTAQLLGTRGDDVRQTAEWEEYKLVVAYDSLQVPALDLFSPGDNSDSVQKSLDIYTACFTIPAEPQDVPNARFFSLSGKRTALIRPINGEVSLAQLCISKFDKELYEAANSFPSWGDSQRQRELMADRFRGDEWETKRLIKDMMVSDSFYLEESVQMKQKCSRNGRCILVGGVADHPPLLAGYGIDAALTWPVELADQIRRWNGHLELAIPFYEKNISDNLALYGAVPWRGLAPKLISPDSTGAVWMQRSTVRVVSWLGLSQYVPRFKKEPVAQAKRACSSPFPPWMVCCCFAGLGCFFLSGGWVYWIYLHSRKRWKRRKTSPQAKQ